MIRTLRDYALLCRQSYMGGAEWVDVGDLRYGFFDGVLCFRGSSNAENWIRDFTIRPAMHNGRLTHAGFVGAFEALRDAILPLIPGPVVCIGHSLGAAIAVLFAEQLDCPAITFGCPRVWVRGFSLPVTNHQYIICDDDPVPMIPRLLYQAFSDPIVLRDADGEIINPGDHDLDVYIQRLEQQETAVAGIKG